MKPWDAELGARPLSAAPCNRARMRAVLLTMRADVFSALSDGCAAAGVAVEACVLVRPEAPVSARDATRVVGVLDEIPSGVDVLMPNSRRGLRQAIAGYEPDLLVVLGLNWRLPPRLLRVPRFGVLNVHCSVLPQYRGPAPMLAAVRNGDPEFGVTVHRMDADFDTGPVLAQCGGVALPEEVTFESSWSLINPVVRKVLPEALGKVAAGDPGVPQDDEGASYARGFTADWEVADWSQSAASIHNLVRVHRFANTGRGPVAVLGEEKVMLLRTSLVPVEGTVRVECVDAPLWIIAHKPVPPSG